MTSPIISEVSETLDTTDTADTADVVEVYDYFDRVVKRVGTGAHINAPSRWLGKRVRVLLLDPLPDSEMEAQVNVG